VSAQPGSVAPPAGGPTVVRPRPRDRRAVFGLLIVLFAVALVRGALGAQTTAGRVTVLVVFGLLTAGTIAVAIAVARNPIVLEVHDDRVLLRGERSGVQLHDALLRADGLVEVVRRGTLKHPIWVVRQPATDRALNLDLLDAAVAAAALRERGWLLDPLAFP
jgi:hypothetical protein